MWRPWIAIFAAAAAAVAAVFWLYGNDLDAARAAAVRGSLIASTTAGPVEYGDEGSGPVVFSIHGAGGGFDQGLANAKDLVGEGYRTVAPSRFGYLRTPVPQDASPAAQADAHAALLAALNVPRAIVVGVSAGARSAVELALRHPERVSALVLVVPGLYSPSSPVSIAPSRGNSFSFWVVNHGGDFAWWCTEKIAPDVLIRFVGVPPSLVATPGAERNRVMGIIKSIEPLSGRFAGINIDSNPNLHERALETVSVPTLIISARDDLFNTLPAAEYTASRIPGARLVTYETGGHLLVGHNAETRAAIAAFLLGLSDKTRTD